MGNWEASGLPTSYDIIHSPSLTCMYVLLSPFTEAPPLPTVGVHHRANGRRHGALRWHAGLV
jgi:hypothetical protein